MTANLTLAVGDYDHVRDLVSGQVRPVGIDVECLVLPVEEIFHRFMVYREWEVSELSLAKLASYVSRGDSPFAGIPVFPSRMFRHASFYVRAGAGIGSAADLAGRTVGIPEWSQTAGIYARALLQERHGVPLEAITWVQAGVDDPGREEHAPLRLPPGVNLKRVADRSLDDLLRLGEIDAIISAHPPRAFRLGEAHITRLFPAAREEDVRYFEQTGIYPIMHVIAIRADALEGRRWIAMNLYKAFDEAKARSLARLGDSQSSRFPYPWGAAELAAAIDLFGADPFPYGIDPNRHTLSQFLSFAFDQGVLERRVEPDELFVPELRSHFKI